MPKRGSPGNCREGRKVYSNKFYVHSKQEPPTVVLEVEPA